MDNLNKESSYLRYLPAIYQGSEAANDSPAFIGRFLLAFEKILTGIADQDTAGDQSVLGLQVQIDRLSEYFDPFKTPPEFLAWLAGWVGLVLPGGSGWDVSKQRQLLARIVPLYQKRGTLEGLREYIRIYVGADAEVVINEYLETLQIGVTATVGVNTIVGESPPYFFQVILKLLTPDPVLLEEKKKAIIAIINREKPAHTDYELIIFVPSLQINVHSTISKDTLLGGAILVDHYWDD